MSTNKLKANKLSFQITAEFGLTNKQVVIGVFSIEDHPTLEEFIKSKDSFFTVADRKKKNPSTVIRTDQIVTIRELERKEITTNKLDL
jgi:hypothetical protein